MKPENRTGIHFSSTNFFAQDFFMDHRYGLNSSSSETICSYTEITGKIKYNKNQWTAKI